MDNPILNACQLGKSGLQVSNIGVGSVGLSGLHGPTNESEAQESIIYSINCGVNFIDTAPFYNNRRAEVLLGDIISKFPRANLCIATKVGRYMDPAAGTERFDYSAETTRKSVFESLKCMKLSYIDLIQIHDVEFAPSLKLLVEETIPCLVDLKKSGYIRSIGITGYPTRHVRKVAECCKEHVDVVMSYFRHNLYDSSLTQDLPFYMDNNIGVINASPLAIGLFTNGGNIPEWNPATDEVKEACKVAVKYCQDHDLDISRLALRDSVESTGVTMTLWSSRKVKNMRSNIGSAILPLTQEEQRALQYIKSDLLSSITNKHWEDKLNEHHPFWSLEQIA